MNAHSSKKSAVPSLICNLKACLVRYLVDVTGIAAGYRNS